MTYLFETRDLKKSFFNIAAVDSVNIQVNPGEVFGLIGQNGAGKSTLMNLIGGVLPPDSGQMLFNGKPHQPRNPADAHKAGIAFIHQELNLFTNLSIAENVFIDGFPQRGVGPLRFIDRQKLNDQTVSVIEQVGLDISPDTVIEEISPGERQLVEIAKALYTDASLIIFDEPTTSLTARETERLFAIMEQLKEQGKALIFISHILEDVRRVSDTIAVMRDGLLMDQRPADTFDIAGMIHLMVGRNLEQLYPPKTAQPTSQPLMTLDHVSAKGMVKGINFTLNKGEVLGLFGLMGSGRTELARIIFGLDEYESGAIAVDEQQLSRQNSPQKSIANNIAFVTENRREEGLMLNISIANNISLVDLTEMTSTPLQILDDAAIAEAALSAATALQLKSGDINVQAAKSLSGGNQQKVVIAKWLLSNPQVFIMDEPTRGVDVGAKYEIYTIIDQLAATGSGVCFISSEIEELMGMCDRILVMSQGEIVGEFARDEFDEEHILRAAFRENRENIHEQIA
jgi:ribose transport system ATP-binding protein